MRIHSHGDLVAAAGLGGRGNASHQVLALVGQVQIDLSAHRSAYGTDTKYTWYLDMPAFNEYGELEGEELYADDEYVITDGVTTFLKPFNNVVCVMTNEQFPKLYIYTPMMNVKGTTAINAATASDRNITISMDGSTITVKAPAETTATLYAVDGRTARRTTLSMRRQEFVRRLNEHVSSQIITDIRFC